MKNPSGKHQEKQPKLSKLLKSLNQASQELQSNPNSSSAIKALLDLKNEADLLLTLDPSLSTLSQHLSELEATLRPRSLHGNNRLKSFLSDRLKSYEVSRLARSIQSEVQPWLDRRALTDLVNDLQKLRADHQGPDDYEEEGESQSLVDKLEAFTSCLSHGFNIELQDLLLRSDIFSDLEWVLVNENIRGHVREKAAIALQWLVLFNKDVFVGNVLMGESIKTLIKMGSVCSLEVLRVLIKAIKSPLVDEVVSFGGVARLVEQLEGGGGGDGDLSVKILAMECLQEIGFYGRKEAVERMMKSGLIERLMELQRSGRPDPFVGCVARFAVQVEVGEGLRRREKRGFKQEIVKRVREASVSDAEAASLISEVLWGTSS